MKHPIQRFSKTELSERKLREIVCEREEPVIIGDLTSDWPAMKKWSFEYLRDIGGKTKVPVLGTASGKEESMLLSDFIQCVMDSGSKESGLRTFATTIRESDILALIPELNQDFTNSSPFFDGFSASWWPLVPPNRPQFYINCKSAYTPTHYDADGAYTFHTVIRGKKSFRLAPYAEAPNIGSKRLLGVGPYMSAFFDEMSDEYSVEAVVEEGETIVLPSRCWHSVRTLEPTISIALRATGNEARVYWRHYLLTFFIGRLFLHRCLEIARRIRSGRLGRIHYGA